MSETLGPNVLEIMECELQETIYSKDSKNNLISTSSYITFISEVYLTNFTTSAKVEDGSLENIQNMMTPSYEII